MSVECMNEASFVCSFECKLKLQQSLLSRTSVFFLLVSTFNSRLFLKIDFFFDDVKFIFIYLFTVFISLGRFNSKE